MEDEFICLSTRGFGKPEVCPSEYPLGMWICGHGSIARMWFIQFSWHTLFFLVRPIVTENMMRSVF
jgi:hypothetical protein